MESHLLIFAFIICAFGVISKTIYVLEYIYILVTHIPVRMAMIIKDRSVDEEVEKREPFVR